MDRARGEELLRELYTAAGLAAPQYFLWHTSPLAAVWTFGALSENQTELTAAFIQHVRQRSDTAAKLKHVQAELQSRLGVSSWPEAVTAVGPWQSLSAGFGGLNPLQLLPTKIKNAQTSFVIKTAGMDALLKRSQMIAGLEPLQALERQVFGHAGDGILAYSAANAGADALRQWMGRTIYNEYSFLDMARDQIFAEEHGAPPPPVLSACWQLAATVGLWWPFTNAVVLAERPVEIQRGSQGALTLIFADGWKAEPYAPRTAPRTKARAVKADELLSVELPRSPEDRIALLRKRSPKLPLYDRYVAGERDQVWRELVDLGPDVRATANLADALAVSYETMARVEANIQTIVQRLNGLRYAFETSPGKTGRPHIPPAGSTWKALRKLEKTAGSLPLALRAFYDVVGEVNLMGFHPALAPRQSSVAPDPLVVFGIEDSREALDGQETDDGALYLPIAPDDLHKANVSGGDPYSIRVPAPVADTIIEFEPHGVTFVEYLRIAFAWGGFPGWENADAIAPPEIGELSKGLLPI